MGIIDHVYYEGCETGDCGGTCPHCTLSICKVCGMAEGGLTTECPQEKVSYELEEQVYAGQVDYRNGTWIKGMRNRPMYGRIEEDIVHEQKYLSSLLKCKVVDYERVYDSRIILSDLKSILDNRKAFDYE